MTDLPSLAAMLLANFATVRIPRCERLWWSPDPEPSLWRHIESMSVALAHESFVADCHRGQLRQCLLNAGNHAFFDRIEGSGPDGWRLHFFCLNPSAVTLLRAAGVGECGPGDPRRSNAKEFVICRLHQLELSNRLSKPSDWWWRFD